MLLDRDIPIRNGDPTLKSIIQSLLVAELLHPSEDLFLVYPWISDIAVLDNSSGQFSTLIPSLGVQPIPLSSVLIELAERGTSVIIGSRQPNVPNPFFSRMEDAASRLPEGQILVRYTERLYEKGMLSHGFYLSGSFNFTENGIEVLEETAQLTFDSRRIGSKLLDFENYWRTEWSQ